MVVDNDHGGGGGAGGSSVQPERQAVEAVS